MSAAWLFRFCLLSFAPWLPRRLPWLLDCLSVSRCLGFGLCRDTGATGVVGIPEKGGAMLELLIVVVIVWLVFVNKK